ncbi:MAG: DUF1003 domain-containing protein [Methylococcaceae bacterium]|nr:DUF1003 domain-containing protein [Methylococcaceae bacterium]MCI0732784.1 DUF1003 domain-containing protein [Methylococcaceae bacterium]
MNDIPVCEIPSPADAGATIVCPACGGENPADAIFCASHACHKALGEFDYVLEELEARRGWIEHLADRVTGFAGRPHFVTFHLVWFVIWVLANSGLVAFLSGFDAYPFALLSFILAIEAILMTGFLLISQNRQQAYSEKRAELDYEVNIRSYRKLIELEKRLDALVRAHASNGTKPVDP